MASSPAQQQAARARAGQVTMRLFDQKRREIKFIEDIAGLRKSWLWLLYSCCLLLCKWCAGHGAWGKSSTHITHIYPYSPSTLTAGPGEEGHVEPSVTNLRPFPGNYPEKHRKGRGHAAGGGGSCGYGMRGQNSRGGVRPGFEGGQTTQYRRAPKWPGRPMGPGHKRTRYALVQVDVSRLWGCGGWGGGVIRVVNFRPAALSGVVVCPHIHPHLTRIPQIST